MRITGGTLSGRTIACPPGVIRPAMDRMRESLFSILGPLDGLSFLDLFSGSGVIALEAVSRGASSVTAVERDTGKRLVLLKNLSIAPTPPTVVFAPAERFLKASRDRYDVVFADPPFDYRFKNDILKRIAPHVAPAGRVVLHYPSTDAIVTEVAGLVMVDERKYGRSMARIFERS